ncbi:DUF1579 domain-containing protein [Rhizobium sp. TRM95111]|uniref:DUF1579 domain-containing protein n=1 Tax=Rhizobium alarense TaxID=2846851 RepID=UPI001F2482C1|nr:DUF1579 domain-containing protein [Rhizobium alarense]MCF3638537.1 DUF1579 domain-containing protein [Rhizobium alarense]
MKMEEPRTEHHWLERLVGDWAESPAAVEAAPEASVWAETVRSMGGFWVVLEGKGQMPGGAPGETLMTIGFDSAKGKYVGTWQGSMMNRLWVYEGFLDPTGNVLTLECDGPDFDVEGKTARYRDVITFVDENHRTFTGLVETEDGSWNKFMETHFWRR